MGGSEELLDPYRVLQVDPTADQEVVQAAYRALARRFHPDVAADQDAAAERMAIINAAFDLIRDPQRRAEYDREHVARPASAHDSDGGLGGEGEADRHGPTYTDGAGPSVYQPGGHTWGAGASWEGTAGPPPGRPSGSVLSFGRFKGWSLGEIARVDAGYLIWLEEKREGRPYVAEIDEMLHRMGLRKPPPAKEAKKGGWRG
ncbi:MAG: J domain-containing protein [Candidatus Limnocylindrales bacterium]